MAWAPKSNTSTFGARAGFGQAAAPAASFGGAATGRFGQAAAAPAGFGARPATGGFGQAAAAGGGGFGQNAGAAGGGGFGQAAAPVNPNAPPNYKPTESSESTTQGTIKLAIQAINAMDFYKNYSFEELRWLNMSNASTIPAAPPQGGAGGGFGQAAGGFGQRTAAPATGFGAKPTASGFGQTGAAAGGGFGQAKAAGGGFGSTGGFGAKPTAAVGGFGGAAKTGFGGGAATGGFGAKPAGFGGAAGAATGGFGAKPAGTGFGQTGAAAGGGFGQRPAGTGFGTTGQQPVFQTGGAATGGFGAKPAGTGFGQGAAATGGFGNSALRQAQGVNRDGTTGAGGGFGAARTGFGAGQTAATGGFGQGTAAGGFGQGTAAGGFGGARPGYGVQQPQAEPVYYTTIASSPFGILPQILKDAATPKQPAEQPKTSATATTPAVSASKRRQAMLPHYKLTPRSEISGAVSRTNASATPGGYDAEVAGRDMFVSKMGGVKKLTIESADQSGFEGSALFNANERARIRSGNSSVVNSVHGSAVAPSTPGGAHRDMNYSMTSPSVVGTPSFPRPGGGALSAGDSASVFSGKYNGPTVAIMTSPTNHASMLSTTPLNGLTSPLNNVNREAPRLTTPGCYTIPSLSELQRKSSSELARLPEFTVGHTKFGTVTWTKSPTDVRNLNLDELVSFQQDSVEVYPESHFPHGSPADGVLNKVATVTIFHVSTSLILARAAGGESKRSTSGQLSERDLDLVTSELRKLTSSFNGRFVSFSLEGNRWTFEVDHFTRYGLSGSNAVPATTTNVNNTSTTSHASSHEGGKNGDSAHSSGNPLFISRSHRSALPTSSLTSTRRSSRSPASKTLELRIEDEENDSENDSEVQPLIPSAMDFDDHDDDTHSVRSRSSAARSQHDAAGSQNGHDDEDAFSDYGRSDGHSSYDDEEEYDEEDGEFNDSETGSDFSQSDSVSSRAHSTHARDYHPHHRTGGDHRTAMGERGDGIESRNVMTSQFPSGRLANRLGLDDQHMHTMQRHLFPLSTGKFESTRRHEISGFDTEPSSKRFKPNDAHVTEVKIRAPSYGMRDGYGAAKKPEFGIESERNKIPFSAPLLPASTSSTEDCFVQVPLNNSVTKNASEVFIDARLRHGRSFRVAWSPDGTLYCPNFTTITHVRPFVAPSSVPQALVPSLEAHKRNASITHAKSHHLLPSISLNDQWNQLVLQQIAISYKHREDMRNALLKFERADLPSGLHQRFDSQVKLALEESYLKFSTEHSAWKLVRTLFGEPQVLEQTLAAAPSYAHDHVESQLRKYALDKWLSEEVEEAVKRDLASLAKEDFSESRQWKVIFALLTGKKIDEAVKIALSLGENRLALMLAQVMDPTELRSQVALQLSTWTRERVLSPATCDASKLEVLSLLAGQVRVVASKTKISQWVRSFAMHFWYGGANPFSTQLSTIVDGYAGIVEASPEHADEEKIHALPVLDEISSQKGNLINSASSESDLSSTRYDVRYHLMKLYADNTLPLDDLLHPNSATKRFDFSLPWMLNSVLLSRQVGMPALNAASVTTGYAQQLEACGLWNWAIYVLLALPASKTPMTESLRNTAVRNILMRNAEHIEKLMISAEDGNRGLKLDETKAAHALLGLDIPHEWLYESLAQYYHYQQKYQEECFLRIKAGQMEEAHSLLSCKWAPTVILQYGVDSSSWPSRFINALNLLESSLEEEEIDENADPLSLRTRNHLLAPYKTHISSSWTFGGHLYVSYRRWFGAVKDAIIAWQTSAASLVDHELLAQLNRDATAFLGLINEWTSALNDVSKYLAILSTNGGSMSQVPWNQLYALSTDAGIALRSRWEMTEADAKAEKIAASDLTSQLVNSIASLKLLIACIDADAPMPSRMSAHLVPLQAYETLDSLEPLSMASLPSDQLSSNLSLLTSRYLDWRVTSL